MELRHRLGEWPGGPAHLLYGPAGVLEFRPAAMMAAHIMMHRPVCWAGCEGHDAPCEVLEMACHPGMVLLGEQVRMLDDLARWAPGELVHGMELLYPELLDVPAGPPDPALADRLRRTPFGEV